MCRQHRACRSCWRRLSASGGCQLRTSSSSSCERGSRSIGSARVDGLAPRCDVGPHLLAGVCRFLMVMAWRSRKRQIVLGAKDAPCSLRSIAASSNSVMSTCASIAARMTSRLASMQWERWSPPWRLARVVPAVRHARTQRTALAAATPLRPAATCLLPPPRSAENKGLATTISPCRLASSSSRHGQSDFDRDGKPCRFQPVRFCSSLAIQKNVLNAETTLYESSTP
jgi:hypothetical protein